jgi:hypothetical protein
MDLVSLNLKMDGVQEKIRELRAQKNNLKETFYG